VKIKTKIDIGSQRAEKYETAITEIECMTVRELKEVLKDANPDAIVTIHVGIRDNISISTELNRVTGIETVEFWDIEYQDKYDEDTIEVIDDDEDKDQLYKCITLYGNDE